MSARTAARPRRHLAAVRTDAAGHARCPRCGALVLVTPAGDLLDPEPHPLAITLPDGSVISVRQAAEVLTGRAAPIGHHPHTTAPGYSCRPARQLTLFSA